MICIQIVKKLFSKLSDFERVRSTLLQFYASNALQRYGNNYMLIHKEKRLTPALSAPVTPRQIDDITYLDKIRLILGFAVRGEIDLGERVINNLE
jgi:hypothetical protein